VNQTQSVVIETQALSKTYKGTQALKALDLRVAKNFIFGFLGPNGAGKTTTIKLLLGLSRPSSGNGKVFGLDIAKDSPQIRQRVGYLAQDPRYYEHMTARQTLRFTAGFFFKGPSSAIEARITETLELVGLDDKADRAIKGFSGGERQRLGIAQAQINDPDLLILDEPAASLDPQGRHDVLEVMERLRKYTTIFYSTQILSDVQRVSDTVAILNHAELVAVAPIDELLNGSGTTLFNLSLRSNWKERLEDTHRRLSGQPWVNAIEEQPNNGVCHWTVNVSDAQAAEALLPRLILEDQTISLIEFGRKRYNLEEVFLRLVEEDNNGR
jgi:ABC-2 type transport system ATP-binding protein